MRTTMRPMETRPLFVADWDDVAFVHFAFLPREIQPLVPFELDLFEGSAYVSLVAFTQRHLRPRVGGRFARMLSAPLASHPFLNVRTYVRRGDETGIHFLCEWIPNRLATLLGPPLYGLPYRLGRLTYRYDREAGTAHHEVIAVDRLAFDCHADPATEATHVASGTLEAFLLERYTAFTRCRGVDTCFRVTHEPWQCRPADVRMRCGDLLASTGIRFDRDPVGGCISPGVKDVGLGPPERLA
jgi:uncharacterized protein YqjF (DUF2071 family)